MNAERQWGPAGTGCLQAVRAYGLGMPSRNERPEALAAYRLGMPLGGECL